jgi:tetratricopeptide (TPR) repeat protein
MNRALYILVGAGSAAVVASAVRFTRGPPAPSPLTQQAERVERGTLLDLLAVESGVSTSSVGGSPQARWMHGLRMEARARRWADFGHGVNDGPVELPETARTLPHRVARALWHQEGAERGLTEAIARAPRPELLEARGRLRLARGRTEAGLRDLLRALELDPNRRHTRRALALHYARTGALDAADEIMQALQADFPADPTLWIDAWALHRGRPGVPAAFPQERHPWEQARRRLIRAFQEGERRLPEAVRGAYPDRPSYQRMLGDVALAWGQPQTSLEHYERAKRLQDGPAIRVAMARARFAQRLRRCADPDVLAERPGGGDGSAEMWGRLRVRPGRFRMLAFEPNARLFPESSYRELIEGEGSDAKGLDRSLGAANRVGLARLCLEERRPRRASRYLETAARIQEDLVRPTLRARALLEAGRPRRAISVLEGAGVFRTAPVLWAEALAASGDAERAVKVLRPVWTATTVVAPGAALRAARWYAKLGRPGDALEALEAASHSVELSSEERQWQSLWHFEAGAVDDALDGVRRQLEAGFDPGEGTPLYRYLAARIIQDRDPDRAEALFRSALGASDVPEDVWVRYVGLLAERSASAARRAARRGLRRVSDRQVRRELRRAVSR